MAVRAFASRNAVLSSNGATARNANASCPAKPQLAVEFVNVWGVKDARPSRASRRTSRRERNVDSCAVQVAAPSGAYSS